MRSVKEYFDNLAEGWRARYRRKADYRERKDIFNEKIKIALKSGRIRSVIEIGFGAYPMFDTNEQGDIEYFAMDLSYDMLRQSPIKNNLFQADFMRMPLKRKFDMIILSSVLEWLENPTIAPILVDGLINANGVVLVSYPNGQSILRLLERIIIQRIKRIAGKKHYTEVQKNIDYQSLKKQFLLQGFCLRNSVFFGKKIFVNGRYSSSMRLDTYVKSQTDENRIKA